GARSGISSPQSVAGVMRYSRSGVSRGDFCFRAPLAIVAGIRRNIMKHLSVIAALFSVLLLAPVGASAQPADASLYSVPGVEVDATAESATLARDRALAGGRPEAWQRLFRRITPPSVWDQQPS